MKTQQPPKIKKYQNEHHKLRVNLMYTYGWMKSRIKIYLDQFDLTQQQFNVLRILRGNYPEPLTTRVITERMIDLNADTSRVVDRLISKELARKVPCYKDKRLVHVHITDNGLDLLEKMDEKVDQLDGITSKLSDEKAKVLNDLLDELRDDI
ncbi:MAG: MarR family transcriptional regulator [Bacteroidota bacterium]